MGYSPNLLRFFALLYLVFRVLGELNARDHEIEWYKRRIRAIQNSYQETANLDNLIGFNQHFAIFLRGFDIESRFNATVGMASYLQNLARYAGTRASIGFNAVFDFTKYPTVVEHTYHSTLYQVLLDPITKYIPVFELLNDRDFTRVPGIARINCQGDWQTTFQHYASKASLLIFLVESLTSGLEYELRWIQETHHENISILLATSAVQRRFKEMGLELAHTLTIPDAESDGLQSVSLQGSVISELEAIACKVVQSSATTKQSTQPNK